MAKEKDELRHLRWVRYAVGGLVVLTLVGAFLGATRNLDTSAKNTAIMAAARTMQEQLNQYHNYWLMNRFPDSVEVSGEVIQFDKKGWVIPLRDGNYDCDLLLDITYPAREVFGLPLQLLLQTTEQDVESCLYLWGKESRHIEIRRDAGFIVTVK